MTPAEMAKSTKVVDHSEEYLRVLRTPSEALIDQVRSGLPYMALESLRERLGVSFSEVGAREVESLIGRIRHGVFT